MINVPVFGKINKSLTTALRTTDKRVGAIVAYEASVFAWTPRRMDTTGKLVWLRRYIVYGVMLQINRDITSTKSYNVSVTDYRKMCTQGDFIKWQKNII